MANHTSLSDYYTKTLVYGLSICFFVLPASWFVTRKAEMVVGIVLLVLILLAIIGRQADWRALLRTPSNYVFWAFLAYFLWRLLCFFIHDDQSKMLDNPARALVGVMLLAVILRLKPRLPALLYGIPLGAVCAFGVAMYDGLVLGARPLAASLMVIQASDIAMSLGLLSLCIAFYFIQKQQKLSGLFAFVGSLAGVVASFLSAARGAWVLMPFLLIYILYVYRKEIKARWLFGLGLGVLVAGVAMLAMPNSLALKKIHTAEKEITAYIEDGKGQTSVGLRFELWRSALISIQEKPIVGWSKEGWKAAKEGQIEAGVISPAARPFDHAHNQFLDDAVKYGLVGMGLLLAVFWAPIIAARFVGSHQPEVILLRTCLTVHVVSVMGYSLTQAFLNHNSGSVFYFVMTVIMLGFLSLQAEKTGNQHETDYS